MKAELPTSLFAVNFDCSYNDLYFYFHNNMQFLYRDCTKSDVFVWYLIFMYLLLFVWMYLFYVFHGQPSSFTLGT